MTLKLYLLICLSAIIVIACGVGLGIVRGSNHILNHLFIAGPYELEDKQDE